MFPIEIRSKVDKEKAVGLIQSRAMNLGVQGAEVLSLVVAADDDLDYGDCIRKSKGFTGGGTHSAGGMGKTVPSVLLDGRVASDLVFTRSVFDQLIGTGKQSEDQKLYDYVVSHELGHALDYANRRVLQPKPPADFGGPVRSLAPYWGPVVLSEFAASFIAGQAIIPDQYQQIADNSTGCISSGMAALGTYKCQVYWNVLVEQAKIAGSSMGSPALHLPEFQRWARIGPDIVAQLEMFVGELRNLNAAYPRWVEADAVALLTNRCEALFQAMKAS